MEISEEVMEELKHKKEKGNAKIMREPQGNFWGDLNLPNKLTLIRAAMIVPFVLLMLVAKCTGVPRYLALIIFCGACVTDFLDGYIARRDRLVTDFGKFMDPLADKLLVVSALICFIALGRIYAWVVIIIVAREFAVSGFRLIAAEKGVVIAAGILGKIKTVLQMAAVILLILDAGTGLIHVLAQIAVYACLVMTVVSFAEYVLRNRELLSTTES